MTKNNFLAIIMSQQGRSWIDNLNPRDLEIKLANRGLQTPGTTNERRRRLRHYERTRAMETEPLDDQQNNPDPNAQPPLDDYDSGESTETAVSSEVPNQQTQDISHNSQADGAAAVLSSKNLNTPLHRREIITNRNTGTISKEVRDKVINNNRGNGRRDPQINPNPVPRVRADSTSGMRPAFADHVPQED